MDDESKVVEAEGEVVKTESDGQQDIDENATNEMLESEENDINVYYEPAEIEMNRRDQNKDQFADII